MKNLVFSVLISLNVLCSPLWAQIPSDGLVAWYPLTQDHKDISGNGYHLLDSAGVKNRIMPLADRFGMFSMGLNMINYNYFSYPFALTGFPALNQDFTFSCWIYSPIVQDEPSDRYDELIGFSSDLTYNQSYQSDLRIGHGDRNEFALIYDWDYFFEWSYLTNPYFNFFNESEYIYPAVNWSKVANKSTGSESWYHLGVTVSQGEMSFYINGWKISVINTRDADVSLSCMALLLNKAVFQDIMLYNRTLSEDEVRSLVKTQSESDLYFSTTGDTSMACPTIYPFSIGVNPQPVLGWLAVSDVAFESAKVTAALGNDAGMEWSAWGWALDTIPVVQWNQGVYHTVDLVSKWDTTQLSNLTRGETYWIRSFLRSSDTILWGDELTFTTTFYGPGNGVTDIDGNDYSTMIYGEDEWMIEDLKVRHDNEGREILVLDETLTENYNAFSYSYPNEGFEYYLWDYYFQQQEPIAQDLYVGDGLLYNPVAVYTIGNICPAGWHVSSAKDWLNLLLTMKVNPQSVSSLSIQGSNQYGLGLTGYGYISDGLMYGGYYNSSGDGGYWLADGNTLPVNFMGSYAGNYGNRIGTWDGSNGNYGYSVRCVKDRMGQESIVSDYANHSDGYCPDTLACNYSPYTASTANWPIPNNNCLIENQPCNDGFENSVNDTAVGCKCIGDFGTVIGDTIVDAEGNRYSTVEIGSQTWMQSNLRTTHDREGNLIDSVFQHGDAVLDSLLGVYYHFAPIYMEGNNYCPIGWHIPTFNDWYVLFDHIGSVLQSGSYYSGFFSNDGEITKKQWGTFQNWNRYASNSLSLDILPNGKLLNMSGIIEGQGSEANLWCWPGDIVHWSDKLHFVGTQNSNFNEQLGIRCIKDN